MYDQNQNIQPDYSFITNQPGPAPKKTPKPLYVFAGVIGVFLLLIGFIFVSSRNNVKKVADGPKFDSAAQVPEQYLRHVGDNQYTEAFKLFSEETKSRSTEDEYKKVAPIMFGNINVSSCVENELTNNASFHYTCALKKGDATMDLSFEVVAQEDTFRIGQFALDLGDGNERKS